MLLLYVHKIKGLNAKTTYLLVSLKAYRTVLYSMLYFMKFTYYQNYKIHGEKQFANVYKISANLV